MNFLDGNQNVPGCQCAGDCEMPCWQRDGIAEACPTCGCPPFTEPARYGPGNPDWEHDRARDLEDGA